MKRTLAALIVITTATTLHPVVAQAQSSDEVMSSNVFLDKDNPVVINQGDRFLGDPNTACTVGYIRGNTFVTAAHCFKKADDLSVYTQTFQYIGRATIDPKYLTAETAEEKFAHDIAVVQLADTVEAGKNIYSGDGITSDVKEGDEVCHYGSTTAKVKCAEYLGKSDAGYHTSTSIFQNGDSGGPLWVKGKGVIGINIYDSAYTDKQGLEKHEGGSSDIDTPFVANAPTEKVKGKYGGLGNAFINDTVEGSSKTMASSKTEAGEGFKNFIIDFLRIWVAPLMFFSDIILHLMAAKDPS